MEEGKKWEGCMNRQMMVENEQARQEGREEEASS